MSVISVYQDQFVHPLVQRNALNVKLELTKSIKLLVKLVLPDLTLKMEQQNVSLVQQDLLLISQDQMNVSRAKQEHTKSIENLVCLVLSEASLPQDPRVSMTVSHVQQDLLLETQLQNNALRAEQELTK